MKKRIHPLLLTVQRIEELLRLAIKRQHPTEKNEGELRIDPKAYSEAELMTLKEAEYELKASRWKIKRMREEGALTELKRKDGIRLIRSEVEAAKKWYSIPKGKI